MGKNYGKKTSGKNTDTRRASGNDMATLLTSLGMAPSKRKEESIPKKKEEKAYSKNSNSNRNGSTGIKDTGIKRFINPYTFVPISNKEPERLKFEDLYKDDCEKFDGSIECTLETKSSVFVPNTSRTFENNFNEFFSYEDLSGRNARDIPEAGPKYPRIPGSEIRGMVRSIYEQLTDSCLSVIDKENLAVKRSPKPKMAGIWDRETDILYKAERKAINIKKLDDLFNGLNGQLDKQFITGTEVYFTYNADGYVTDISMKYFKNAVKGVALKGEDFSTKKNESVITLELKTKECTLTKLDKNRFKAVLDRYKGYNDYKKAYDSDIRYMPVFYEKVDKKSDKQVDTKLYLAPAMMTKEVFENTISEILEKNHFKHHHCTAETGFCPACRLFGTIANEKSLASRLRFTDTEVFENFTFDKPRFMPVLGTPRYSSTEFYLEKPKYSGVSMWNYDYYTINNGKKIESQSTYESHLKGRKVYWLGSDKLNRENTLEQYKISSKDRLNKTGKDNINIRTAGRALKSGAKTKFKVYFEDITVEELASLLYSLSLGKDCNHRIGRGKPYGMGAVKVEIEKLKIREYGLKNGEISITEKESDPGIYILGNREEANKKYIELYSAPLSKEEGELVEYPTSMDGDEIFRWFANNRGSVQAPEIEQCLPVIISNNRYLRKNQKNSTNQKKG